MKKSSKIIIAVICTAASAFLVLICVAVWLLFHLSLEAFENENDEFLNKYGAWVETVETDSDHKLNFARADFHGGYDSVTFENLDYDISLNEQISLAYGTFSSFKEQCNEKYPDNSEYAGVKIVFNNGYIEMNNATDELRIFTNIEDDNINDEIYGMIEEKYDLIMR